MPSTGPRPGSVGTPQPIWTGWRFSCACARPACPSPTCNDSPSSVAKAAPASPTGSSCSPATATPSNGTSPTCRATSKSSTPRSLTTRACSMSRPERISYEHRSTNSHQVSEQQLLGPEVEQALYDRGAQVLAAVDGEGGQSVVDALADIAPAPAHHVVAFALGDVYARPGLTHAQRQLVTLGMLTALGGCEAQLEVHVNASLNVGLTPTEIVEAITPTAVYCGFPKALNAIFVAKRVFAERDLLPVNAPAA